jgi:hypothetical protein
VSVIIINIKRSFVNEIFCESESVWQGVRGGRLLPLAAPLLLLIRAVGSCGGCLSLAGFAVAVATGVAVQCVTVGE